MVAHHQLREGGGILSGVGGGDQAGVDKRDVEAGDGAVDDLLKGQPTGGVQVRREAQLDVDHVVLHEPLEMRPDLGGQLGGGLRGRAGEVVVEEDLGKVGNVAHGDHPNGGIRCLSS